VLYRLIYVSETAQTLNPDAVQTLLTQARRNNALRDVTGMLALNSRWFLQAVEGASPVLNQLYCNLMHDLRHRKLQLLSFEPIAQRQFAQWSMGFAAANANLRADYLRYGPSGSFEPQLMSGSASLDMLVAWRQRQLSAPALLV
jgi:hypothetical protein